jgi:hypothetical protein
VPRRLDLPPSLSSDVADRLDPEPLDRQFKDLMDALGPLDKRLMIGRYVENLPFPYEGAEMYSAHPNNRANQPKAVSSC